MPLGKVWAFGGWVEAVPLQAAAAAAADRRSGRAANRPQRKIQQGGDTVRDREEGRTVTRRDRRR